MEGESNFRYKILRQIGQNCSQHKSLNNLQSYLGKKAFRMNLKEKSI